ncbi:MAG: S53 family peptidase [Ktedonobacteraceae bacterium]|nr:S53 family peptidase [Ktedonobacteraceae bacterium]
MNLPPSYGVRKSQERRAWVKRVTVALPLLCLLIFGAVIGVRLSSNSTGASAAGLVSLSGHVPSLVKKSSLVGAADPNQSLTLSIGLKLRNTDSLKSYVDSQSKAHTVSKHHLKPSEVTAAYAPLSSSQQRVITYLRGYGFTVTLTVSQHLVIGIKGTVADAENAFHLHINNYHSSTGRDFYAPASNPLVPANLAGLIQSISGLDNVRHFTHPPVKSTKRSVSAVKANGVSCLGQGSASNGYYLPSQFATGYNLTGLYNAGYHGEGQTIGLVEFDNYSSSDISAYTRCYGGASVPINRVLVDGGAGNPSQGAFEVELDMETILSATPKLAGLNVYEAPNNDTGNIDMWGQIISNDAVPVVSTSWGVCEPGANSTALQQENSLFMLAAAQGQTIVAASGDYGTNDCRIPLSSTNPVPFQAVDDPASQPYVTGVGGTTLTLNGNNTYNSETVWNNHFIQTLDDVLAGGGGLSSVWHRPDWQSGPGVINGYSNGQREVPDVSLNADPNIGYLVYCSVAATGCSAAGFYSAGGTSAAAPMWAAFIALTNEKTLHDGGFNIGFINPYLYQINQNTGGTSYSNDFHDVTSGNNDGLNDGKTIYPATAQYDLASGLGSYNALNLANDLETLANTKNGARSAPANKTWYFAEGSVGGQFTEYLTLLNPNASQAAHVSVQYLFENQAAVTKTYTLAASTRFTLNVNDELGIAPPAAQQAISAIVTSDVAIVAERPMYFNRPDLSSSGTDVLGATHATNTTFYFAAGDTNQTSSDNSREFITILNPNSSTATITATYYSGGQVVDSENLSVLALHRGTITTPYRGLAAIKVTSTIGVVIERPIYFKINVPTAGGTVTGAASTIAATTPGNDWLFAEGHTADNFQENLVLANFNTGTASATVKLEYTNGAVQNVPVTISAQSQLTFDVNNAYLHPVSGFSGTTTPDVSIEVTSTSPIVAERVMYFKYKGAISGGTDVVGQPGPSAPSVYSFAEGYTTSSFEEWLTLQNPNANSEVVDITLFFDGTIVQKEMTLAPHSRTTININSIVTPVATAYPSPTAYAVSMDVQVFGGGTVVVERPLYFNYGGVSPGGTDIIGYTGN